MSQLPSSGTTRRRLDLHGYWQLPEPPLAFDPVDAAQIAINPLVGLRDHGPFSRRAFDKVDVPIRVALLAPKADLHQLRAQLNELMRPHDPKERKAYVPPWPGFRQVFHVSLAPADASAQVSLSEKLDLELAEAISPHEHLAGALVGGLRSLTMVRDRFDVVVFYLPPRYRSFFENRDQDFDLHDTVKAVAAEVGLRTQILTQDALTYRCRASVAWRLGTALYAKGGGVPWKLDTRRPPLDPDTSYIGLSYALRRGSGGRTVFVTCCSQVFDSDGGGMEFVAHEVGQGTDPRNPFLSRDDMRTVMSRSLALYQDRHLGRSPKRLVVHKQTPFTAGEQSGCSDAWGATSDLACINITRSPWQGVALDAPRKLPEKNTPAYAMPRGTTFQLDGRSALLWVAGNAPTATLDGSSNYLQGGKGTPRPLLLTRDLGSGPLEEVAGQVLALSKMDWNNDSLYDGLPCTLRYAQVLARTVKHIRTLAPQPYDYRLFM